MLSNDKNAIASVLLELGFHRLTTLRNLMPNIYIQD